MIDSSKIDVCERSVRSMCAIDVCTDLSSTYQEMCAQISEGLDTLPALTKWMASIKIYQDVSRCNGLYLDVSRWTSSGNERLQTNEWWALKICCVSDRLMRRYKHFTRISHAFHTHFTLISHSFHTHFTLISHSFHTHFTLISDWWEDTFQMNDEHQRYVCISLTHHRYMVCEIDIWEDTLHTHFTQYETHSWEEARHGNLRMDKHRDIWRMTHESVIECDSCVR